MKTLKFVFLVLLVSPLIIGHAYAAPSCSNWLEQSDGSFWRTCVDDNGSQYCELSKNGIISKVSCSK